MKRNGRAVLVLAGIAAGSALSLSGCGSATSAPSAPGGSSSGVTVAPRIGAPQTTFNFRFRPPEASGPRGAVRFGYTLGVIGPARPGCVAQAARPVAHAVKGVEVLVRLNPAGSGGAWCQGTFRAQVTEFQAPVCAAGTMCPQFIRVVAVIGKTTFRVSAP